MLEAGEGAFPPEENTFAQVYPRVPAASRRPSWAPLWGCDPWDGFRLNRFTLSTFFLRTVYFLSEQLR